MKDRIIDCLLPAWEMALRVSLIPVWADLNVTARICGFVWYGVLTEGQARGK